MYIWYHIYVYIDDDKTVDQQTLGATWDILSKLDTNNS